MGNPDGQELQVIINCLEEVAKAFRRGMAFCHPAKDSPPEKLKELCDNTTCRLASPQNQCVSGVTHKELQWIMNDVAEGVGAGWRRLRKVVVWVHLGTRQTAGGVATARVEDSRKSKGVSGKELSFKFVRTPVGIACFG